MYRDTDLPERSFADAQDDRDGAQDDNEDVLDANRENMSVHHLYNYVEMVLKTGK